jgi:carbon monoxide dehydrogenase subunit G
VQLTSAVRIGRPAPEVLDALLDAGKVAACLPGSRLIGEVDEGTYAGEIQLRIGPVDAVYAGTVHLDAADRAAGTARLRATGQERSGQGSADARVTLRVEPHGASTRVLISADLMIRGSVAQYAAGAIGDVGQRLVEQFAGNVERLLASQATTGGAAQGAVLASPAGAAREPATRELAAAEPAAGQPAARRLRPRPLRTAAQKRTAAAAAALLAAGALAGLLAAWAAWRRRHPPHQAPHLAPHLVPHPDPPVPPYTSPEGARHG